MIDRALKQILTAAPSLPASHGTEIYMIDTETTGLEGYPTDLVVEIGICKIDLVNETVEDVFTAVVGYETEHWSDKQKDSWIFSNSTLTLQDVDQAVLAHNLAYHILPILYGKPATSYNTEFDFVRFLYKKPWYLRNAIIEVADPMLAASKVCGLTRDGRPKHPKLEEAYDMIVDGDPAGIDGNQAHRAISDARVASHVMLQMYRDGTYAPEIVRRRP